MPPLAEASQGGQGAQSHADAPSLGLRASRRCPGRTLGRQLAACPRPTPASASHAAQGAVTPVSSGVSSVSGG